MSKKEKVTEQAEQKVVTKYDRKLQKRKEQKEKEKRQQRKNTLIGVAILAIVVCVVASFPIRTYIATHQTYITIGGEDITKVEFDYNYNVVLGNYVSQYGDYLPYMGLDTTQDLSTQMYSETLSWKDYFEQMAVENMLQSIAIKAKADAEGFTYDTTEEYEQFKDALKQVAAENGVSTSDYVKQSYGSYATLSRIAPYIKENIVVSAYYEKLAEENTPSDEEVQAYYESDTASYDSVDYRMTVVQAELPTEPTELADTTDTTETTSTDSTAYEPSDAEIEKAMEDAMVLAEEAETKVTNAGELVEGATKSATTSTIRDWLFDDARTAGETTIIEDTYNNQYYVLAFEQRYLDQTPSVDVRVIVPDEKDGQAILDEWKSGEATEESFAELARTYSTDSSAMDGGLCEGTTATGMSEELSSWLFDAARAAGDTTSITTTDGYTFVMYYVGQNDPEWKLSIQNTLVNEALTAIVEEITAGIEVEDTKGNLNYLKVQEAEAAAEAEAGTEAETEAEASTESSAAAK